ncbi:hypothetical protein FRC20_010847 [Serendipita sp. 405]|nr:hypothetical protein FRC20_010847 [Serendipita sp. 405]
MGKNLLKALSVLILGQGFQSWRPALALWGVGTGVTLSLLLSNTPIFKNDVLTKIPLFGNIWVDNTPAEDKPF